MSTYVMSDLHGQLDAFNDLLEQTGFQPDKDQLFLLGDYVDWGPKSIELMLRIIKMMEQGQPVRCLLGNHDLLMRHVISHLDTKSEGWLENLEDDEWYEWWRDNAGLETLLQYVSLSDYRRKKIKKFLKNLELYIEDVCVGGRKYYLCHSVPFKKDITEPMPLLEHLFCRTSEYYFTPFRKTHPDDIIVCGHTITHYYWTDRRNLKYEPCGDISITPHLDGDTFQVYYDADERFINLDCGGKMLGSPRYAAKLSCLRLDDLQAFYSTKM